MDEGGNIFVAHQTEGLLLYSDGTVCNSGFSDNSADAICREMGYNAATSWRTGLLYGSQQSDRNISLNEVTCSSNDWSSCTSNSTVANEDNHHAKDILLTCEYGIFYKIIK